jgi:hypothetical protein
MMANEKTAMDPVIEILSNTKSKTALIRGANSGQYLNTLMCCMLIKREK